MPATSARTTAGNHIGPLLSHDAPEIARSVTPEAGDAIRARYSHAPSSGKARVATVSYGFLATRAHDSPAGRRRSAMLWRDETTRGTGRCGARWDPGRCRR